MYITHEVLPANATNQNVTWVSSNPNVATIDRYTGVITPLAAEVTRIFVIANDGAHLDDSFIQVATN